MNTDSLFLPTSIAVIGASTTIGKVGNIVSENVVTGGFEGNIFLINARAKGENLFGHPLFASISEISEKIDLVLVCIPAEYVLEQVELCGKQGVSYIVILSAGFSEAHEEEREEKLRTLCKKYNITLIGPNCLGIVLPWIKLNASFADKEVPCGNVGLISQSGAICTAMIDWAKSEGIGFSGVFSLGNKAGIDECELLDLFYLDPHTRVIVLYLEEILHGELFLSKLSHHPKNKKVIVYIPGKNSSSQKALSSHTGSVASDPKVAKKAIEETGAVFADSLREIFSLLTFFASSQKTFPINPSITIITNAGGVGVATVDSFDHYGVSLDAHTESTLSQFKDLFQEASSGTNPFDILGDAGSQKYALAGSLLLPIPETTNLLFLLTPQKNTDVDDVAKKIYELSLTTEKNIFCAFLGGERVEGARRYLINHGVPAFSFAEDALLAFSRSITRQKTEIPTSPIFLSPSKISHLRERILFEKKMSRSLLSFTLVSEIANSFDLPLPVQKEVFSLDEAISFCENIRSKKVVGKILCSQTAHKTEIGGVMITLKEDISSLWERLSYQKNVLLENGEFASIILQEQITDFQEVFVGVKRSADFGQVMVFGTGGIFTEVYQDLSMTHLPCSDFESFISETKISHILGGARKQTPYSLTSLVKTLQKIQYLALSLPEIQMIDFNPLFVGHDRCECVDVKMFV